MKIAVVVTVLFKIIFFIKVPATHGKVICSFLYLNNASVTPKVLRPNLLLSTRPFRNGYAPL